MPLRGELVAEAPATFHLRDVSFEGVSGKALSAEELRQIQLLLKQHSDGVWFYDETAAKSVTLDSFLKTSPHSIDASVIRGIASAVLKTYTDRKFAAVRVEIPQDSIPQLVQPDGTGILIVRVIEGRVTKVRALDAAAATSEEPVKALKPNARFDRIAELSPIQANDLIRLDIANNHVNWLNRHPGRYVTAALSPNPEQNELNLDYLVNEFALWTAYIQLSNTGTDTTTDWRERFGFQHYSLTDADDIFTIDYLTGNFDEVHALSLSYDRPLPGSPRTRAKLSGSWSTYTASEVGLAGLGTDLDGENMTLGLELSHTYFQDRDFFADAFIGLRFEHVEANNNIALISGETNFLLLSLGLRADRQTQTQSSYASLSLETNLAGLANTDSSELPGLGRSEVDRDWVSLNGWVSHAFFIEPLINPAWGKADNGSTLANQIYLSLRGQFILGDHRVAPGFTNVIGGLYTVRGYPESYASADNGILFTAEYRVHPTRLFAPGPPGELFGSTFRYRPERSLGSADWNLLLRAFFDAGHTWHNDRLAFESNQTLVSTGIGCELSFKTNAVLRIDWGIALRDTDNGSDEVDAGDSRLHVVFTLSF